MMACYLVLLLGCLFTLLPTVTSITLPVSFDSGNDTTCLPCKTIEGAFRFQRTLSLGDIILVEPIQGGGVYNLQQTVVVTVPVILMGSAGVNISCNGLPTGFMVYASSFVLDTVTIQGCSGTALYSNTTLQVANCNFISNQNAFHLEQAGNANITKSSFSYHSGPVINAFVGRTLTITNCNFLFNFGSIVINTTASTLIQKSNFISNGMSVYIFSDGKLEIEDSIISDSIFDAVPGTAAVAAQNSNTAILTNVTFTRNRVRTGQSPYAVAFYSVTEILFSTCSFIDNQGGTIVLLSGDLKISSVLNVEFSGNVANASIFSIAPTSGSSIGIANSQFINNHALNLNYGGAISAAAGPVVLAIQNCTFFSNSASEGGAIYTQTYTSIYASTFFNNSASSAGGAVFFDAANGISNSNNFTSCSAQNGNGGAILVGGENFTDFHSSFTNNSANECGAISMVNSANLTGSTFFYNSAFNGGAVCAFSISDTYLGNCTFLGNHADASGSGGAIYAFNYAAAVVHLDGCTLVNNTASTGGGFGAYGSSACMEAHNSTFIGNSATQSGGAVDVNNVACSGCIFTKNSSPAGKGGALNVQGGSILQNCTFLGNVAQNGGGVNYASTANATMTVCVFGTNRAAQFGGAIYAQPLGTLALSQTSFSFNSAVQDGGALFAQQIRAITLSLVTFYDNSANRFGGAIATYSFLTCHNCTFQENSAAISGGAVYVNSTTASQTNTVFAGNKANYGGAFFGVNSLISFAACTLIANHAAIQGGGIYTSGASISSTSDVIQTSSSEEGGGFFITNSTGKFVGSKISNNSAIAHGGGIFLDSNLTIVNGVILHNTAPTGDGIYIQSKAAQLVISGTNLSNSSPFAFCCGGEAKNNIQNEICTYPPCSQGCGIVATGSSCECSTFPSTNCSCSPQFTGDYCNVADPCFNNSVCTACTLDESYSIATCCNQGFYLAENNTCQDVNECEENNTCAPNAACTNLPGTFFCTCPSGTSGNASILCTACTNSTCYPGVSCTTIGTNYSCGACPTGYAGTGIGATGCQDIDECIMNPNGKCDMHTNCTNTIGFFICSACPPLFSGLGNETCTPLCGDGTCSPELGEQCITCPIDCPLPCGLCGDSNCDSSLSENCTTCSADCGTCKALGCSSECSKRGTCINGICSCVGNWGGPSCNSVNNDFTLNVSTTDPGFTIITNNSNKQVDFTISFKEIREIDQSGNIVSSFDLANYNFTFAQFAPFNNYSGNNTVEACNHCDLSFYVQTSGGVDNTQFSTNITLANLAYLEIMIWNLETTTMVTFANISTNFAAKTAKVAVQIRNWPFKALQNSLVLVLDSIYDSSHTPCVHKLEDENDNLKWLTVNINGVSLYSQFFDVMVIDGALRKINYRIEPDSSILVNIPHFWVNAVLDPTFSVLLDPSDCHTSRRFVKILEIVIPIAFVLIVLLVVFLRYLARIRSYFFAKRSSRRLSKTSIARDEKELDKIKPNVGVHMYDTNATRL